MAKLISSCTICPHTFCDFFLYFVDDRHFCAGHVFRYWTGIHLYLHFQIWRFDNQSHEPHTESNHINGFHRHIWSRLGGYADCGFGSQSGGDDHECLQAKEKGRRLNNNTNENTIF